MPALMPLRRTGSRDPWPLTMLQKGGKAGWQAGEVRMARGAVTR